MAPSEELTAPDLQALLKGGTLAGEWTLDPRGSSVGLRSKSMGGLVRVNGVFSDVSGNGTISPDGEVSGTLTVVAASVDTKNTRRDKHLRSADLLDSGNYPDISCTVDSVRPSGSGVTVTGALAVHGSTRPLSFDAAVSVPADGEVWLDAEVQVNRAEFGISWNMLGLVSMNSTLAIHAVFSRQ